MCLCECMSHMCRCPPVEARGVLDPLKLELQAVVGCLVWVLRTESGPSGRVRRTLNQGAVSAALRHLRTARATE